MEVPPDGSNINEYVEELMNESDIVQYHCQDGCQSNFQAENRIQIKSHPEFIIIILRRSVMAENGLEIVENTFNSTNNISIRLDRLLKIFKIIVYHVRDYAGANGNYEAIAVIQHEGGIATDGITQGHYICDIKWKHSSTWFRTNDNSIPIPMSLQEVTKKGVVILYKQICQN